MKGARVSTGKSPITLDQNHAEMEYMPGHVSDNGKLTQSYTGGAIRAKKISHGIARERAPCFTLGLGHHRLGTSPVSKFLDDGTAKLSGCCQRNLLCFFSALALIMYARTDGQTD